MTTMLLASRRFLSTSCVSVSVTRNRFSCEYHYSKIHKAQVFKRFMTTPAIQNDKPSSLTAACCIIGDEILNGKTRDSNAHFLARYLFELGIDLKRVEIISDDYEAIADTVRRLSNQHDLVFTSGGIGPTHDDISYEAIARAYSLELKLDSETCREMEKTMRAKYADWELTEARKRMALLPYPAKILRVAPDELWVPVVVVNENIHILPGIPRLFERLLTLLRPHFEKMVLDRGAGGGYFRVQIATRLQEGEIAPILTAIQQRVLDQHIKIGSYPKWGADRNGVRVVLSIVGRDEEAVKNIGNEIASSVNGWLYESVKPI